MFRKVEQELGIKIPDALKKLSGGKWEWIPEWGDWVVHNHKARIVIGINPNWITLATGNEEQAGVLKSSCTPLLHWEKLEEIMYQLGFTMENPTFLSVWKTHFSDQSGTKYREGYGKTRQEAVQKAVIALAKEKE